MEVFDPAAGTQRHSAGYRFQVHYAIQGEEAVRFREMAVRFEITNHQLVTAALRFAAKHMVEK